MHKQQKYWRATRLARIFSAALAGTIMFVAPTSNSLADPADGGVYRPEFPAGGWRLAGNGQKTYISVGIPPQVGPFKFLISSSAGTDGDEPQYSITADGGKLAEPFDEGNSVLVEARNVSIEQSRAGETGVATWKVVYREGQTETRDVEYSWGAKPNKLSLVASFKEPTLMVISLNDVTRCTGEKMSVSVDGNFLRDRNNILQWHARSSVMIYGKKVAVFGQGNCPVNHFMQGSLAYLDQ